jgi:S-adenosylmethionine decarboxylase|tara:strand:+ start:4433 stop:4801 length:369 start_codon:yes stop_codon:yes gene_type:complete
MEAISGVGKHYLVDLRDCDPEIITCVKLTRNIVMHAAKACGATILNDHFHQFQPIGVSGVVLIAESHISVHTWPENGFAAMDIFTCGNMEPQVAIDIIQKGFCAKAASMSLKVVTRGLLDGD